MTRSRQGVTALMAYVEVGMDGRSKVELCYEDLGEGRPVVLVHDWPLSRHMWEAQVPELVEAGHRVISYDRREALSTWFGPS